jgi:CSLREA domain-containing protein
MRRFILVTTGLVLLLCLVAPPTSAVREHNRFLQPQDYIVNSTADPGDGICNLAQCTLREAITAANGDGEVSNIAFNIPPSDGGYNPSTGVWTIDLDSNLPALTDEATGVMGSTQTGNQGDTNPYGPEIAVNGGSSHYCFRLWSAYNTIKGLAINQCTKGIVIAGSEVHHNSIRGNYIGLHAQGTAASGNTEDGIYIGYSSDNTIGGSTTNERNMISGNGVRGVFVFGEDAARNIIAGNYIGTDSSGLVDVGNVYGVIISGGAQDNDIGPDNIIAYNDDHGVWISGSATISNTVTQNSIHTNVGKGIHLSDGANGNLAAAYDVVGWCLGGHAYSGADLTWEAFSDFDAEGRFFELTGGTATGSFTFWPAGNMFRYPYVTLTVTDADGNTSEFSDPFPSDCLFRYLPLSMKGY